MVSNKTPESIVKAFRKIYLRPVLNKPNHIEFDSGTEFKGACTEFFKNLNITIRYADPNTYRQKALVENANQKIGKIIFMLQNQKELQTKKQCRVWVVFLRKIINELNDDSKQKN